MKKVMPTLFGLFCLVCVNAQLIVAQDKGAQNKPLNSASQKVAATKGDKPSVASDPWEGTWKMDIRQSKLHGPAPKEETLVVESVTASHVKYSIKSVGQNGQYTITYDGKPDSASPVMVDGKEAGTATFHRVTYRQYSGIRVMACGLTTTEIITLSPDHKKTTVKLHAKEQKAEYDETAVYTR